MLELNDTAAYLEGTYAIQHPELSDAVTAMKSAWGTPRMWELSARNSVSGVQWDNSQTTEKYLKNGLRPGYQIVSLHTTDVSCAEVRLDGQAKFSGHLAAGSWMMVPSAGNPEAVTHGRFQLMHVYVPDKLLLNTSADYDLTLDLPDLERLYHGDGDQTGISHACRALANAAQTTGPLRDLSIDTLSRTLVTELLFLVCGQPSQRRDVLSRVVINRLEEYLQTSLFTPLTPDDLACVADLSPAHFSRAFSASFGRSPMREIQHRRLLVAARLLRDTSQPVSDIAARTGFSDQSHLTRAFHKKFGTPPATYRKYH